MEDFTHTVFVEYATLTTCGPCVTASSQLYSIYNAGDLDFNYVSLVSDEATSNIRNRLQDLGVIAVPRVFFDGGYKDISGAKPDEQPYRTAITQSGERTVPDIDITPSATLKSSGTIKIEVTVVNNEVEEYNGILRVFVVEKESRWNDNGGNPYHYAALDIAIDRSLALSGSNVKPLGDTYTFSKTWLGALYGFSDITADNIIIIAALYDSDTEYAVQSASAEPTRENSRFRSINPLLIQRLANWFPILSKLLSL
jgi:glutaredoxin